MIYTIVAKYNKLFSFIAILLLICTSSTMTFASQAKLNTSPIKKYAYYWKNFTLENFQEKLSKASDQGITTIYLNTEFFLNPWLDQKKTFKQISDMIIMAKSYGISIHSMMGNTTWADPFTDEIIYRTLAFIQKYNSNNPLNLIEGLHLNIEFYNKRGFTDSKFYTTQNFIKFNDNLSSEIKKYQTIVPQFELSTTIPHFSEYDRSIPNVEYEGVKTSLFEHIARTFNNLPNSRLVIMAYRSFGEGDDSILDITKNEFEIIKKRFNKVKVIIAVENIDVKDTLISFYGKSRRQIDQELVKVHHNLVDTKSYAGMAIHGLDEYINLKD
jgi:hypothetical protein